MYQILFDWRLGQSRPVRFSGRELFVEVSIRSVSMSMGK